MEDYTDSIYDIFKDIKSTTWLGNDDRFASETQDSVDKKALLGIVNAMVGDSADMQLRVVVMKPTNIQYIKQPCEEAMIMAVSMDPSTIKLIENPPEVVKTASIIIK